jgi:hypothetical protein
MPYRGAYPKILWGSGLANTLVFGYPLDSVKSWSALRPGSERARFGAFTDAWVTGRDYFLSAQSRWIPGVSTASATGWDGSTGWDAFLQWAQDCNTVRFYPDRNQTAYWDVVLEEPTGEDANAEPELESDATRSVKLKLRATTPFTGF